MAVISVRHIFTPETPPDEEQLRQSRRRVIAEGAVASVIYAIATGNLYMGYLSQMGASISLCAVAAMIPQLGCVLQFFSPFLFERFRLRKGAIWICCVLYRFAVSFSLLTAQTMGGSGAALGASLALYFVAFMAAGLVTPALQHMILSIAPQKGRGSFFARKDIVAACVNSLSVLALGRILDAFGSSGTPMIGYTIIAAASLALSVVDALLLGSVHEPPVPFSRKLSWRRLGEPIKDARYRSVFRYTVLAGFFSGLSSTFLTIYLLRGLMLSHTFITTANFAASAAGMIGSWLWGRYSDHTTWNVIIKRAAPVAMLCTLGWGLMTREMAAWIAPVLLIVTAVCNGGTSIAALNLQYVCSPEESKTTYIGVTSAVSSVVGCLSAAISTSVQPILEIGLGERSISVLFLASAIGGFCNLFFNARKLPECR